MLRRRAAWVIAAVARAEGDRRAMIPALGQMDPLARGLVLSRVSRAVAAAMQETLHADDDAHVHRLAYLALAGKHAEVWDDVESVREAFERETRDLRMPMRFGPTLALLSTFAASIVLGCAGLWYWTRPPAPLREELAVSADAWSSGGRPEAGSAETRALFEEALPRYVIALDALARGYGTDEEERAQQALDRVHGEIAEHARRALGPDTASFFIAVLDQSEQIIADPSFDVAADSHLRSIDALVNALAEQGLGYYVDAIIVTERGERRHRIYFSTFTVERVSFHRAEGQRVRTLRLKRLDRLNFQRGLLGFTRENISDALVLLTRVEDFMVDAVLPALGPEASMPLVDDDARRSNEPWIAEVERAMAEDARAEARALAGEEAESLGALFARRQALFRTWSERLAPGWVVRPPRSYEIELRSYASVEPRVPRAEWVELRRIQSELDGDDARGAYRALEEALVQSIERHEVQHRLDYASGRLGAAPPELEELTGPLEWNGRPNRLTRRAVAELSAYTSELARGTALVRTTLALVSRFVFDRRSWGTAECYAAIVLLEGIGRELGVEVELVRGRTIDRQALARLVLSLRERSPDELRRAAASVWQTLYSAPLAALE